MKGKHVTIVDVAALVGVSAKTVSRVVNKDPNVSQRVRDAVSRAIAELGYRPNLAARALASSRSYTIGVITPDVESTYFQAIHSHVFRSARKFNYHVIAEKLAMSHPLMIDELRMLLDKVRFAGAILATGVATSSKVVKLLDSRDVRWVGFGSRANVGSGHSVVSEEESGEEMLADHLWSLGHRRIAVMRADRTDKHRGRAFAARLRKRGGDPAALTWLDFRSFTPALEVGRQAALSVLRMTDRPTAVFAYNDDVAAGVISTLLTRNVSVPGDISVVGFDDSEIAQAIWPALTTVRQPLAQMADAAVDILVSREPPTPAVVRRPVSLIIRESTAPTP